MGSNMANLIPDNRAEEQLSIAKVREHEHYNAISLDFDKIEMGASEILMIDVELERCKINYS